MQSIEITIPRTGLSTKKTAVKTEANGFTGEGCKAFTDIFTNALGSLRAEEPKPELYAKGEVHEQIHEGNPDA